MDGRTAARAAARARPERFSEPYMTHGWVACKALARDARHRARTRPKKQREVHKTVRKKLLDSECAFVLARPPLRWPPPPWLAPRSSRRSATITRLPSSLTMQSPTARRKACGGEPWLRRGSALRCRALRACVPLARARRTAARACLGADVEHAALLAARLAAIGSCRGARRPVTGSEARGRAAGSPPRPRECARLRECALRRLEPP